MTTFRFEDVLACLRQVEWACAPPIGIGEFEILYVSAVEVVVWYTPAREGQHMGEVAIPCARIAAAWHQLHAGRVFDDDGLSRACGSVGVGRWVLALLSLVPGTHVAPEPLTISWTSPAAATDNAPVAEVTAKSAGRREVAGG